MTGKEALMWALLLLNVVMLIWNLSLGNWAFIISVFGILFMIYSLNSHYRDKY